jgi:hypothetical protein
MLGLEFYNPGECAPRGANFAQFGEQKAQFVMDGGKVWPLRGHLFQESACTRNVALRPFGAHQQEQRVRLCRDGPEECPRLVFGPGGIGGEQVRRLRENSPQRS